jgi:hypothetical protein
VFGAKDTDWPRNEFVPSAGAKGGMA